MVVLTFLCLTIASALLRPMPNNCSKSSTVAVLMSIRLEAIVPRHHRHPARINTDHFLINISGVVGGIIWVRYIIHVRGAIQNYVDFCCKIFILQPIASFFSQNKVLS